SIDYDRNAISGGAALYTLPNSASLKFKVEFVFSNGEFSFPRQNITTLSALSDMLIMGGFGQKNYAQIEKELSENGINLSAKINTLGELTISCEALKDDFQRVLEIVHDLILKPTFDSSALVLWKQQTQNAFNSFSNANT